jgi:hypothetical protein
MDIITLTTFKAIVNFTESIGDIFANKNRGLKLYQHLISKTTFCHDKAIEKHINAFKKFCVTNRDAILENDEKKIQMNNITYSNKVYINIPFILGMCASDQKNAIWKHLLVISALTDPLSRAKEILKNKKEEEDKEKNSESNFLSKIMDKVEKNIDVNADPMSAVSSIMSSGMFNEMIDEMNTGMQNGSIDLGKLLGTVQTMVSETNGNSSGTEGNIPDLSGIMSMIGPMLGPMMATMNTNPQQSSQSSQSSPKMLEIE